MKLWAAPVLACVIACAPVLSAPSDASAPVPAPGAETNTQTDASQAADARGPLPIHPEDTRWGSADAPVTIVAFVDLECRFCAKAWAVLEELEKRYGREKLRVVVKHYPLPFHRFAGAAARSTLAVQRARGSEAAYAFITTVFRQQQDLSEFNLQEWMRAVGVPDMPNGSPSPAQQIARDTELVSKIGVTGTPTVFINGIRVTGAHPYEVYAAHIDDELAAAAEAKNKGLPWAHADRVAVNLSEPPVIEAGKAAPEEDFQLWKIPVGTSPVLGPADALVTIVEFSDYQCPYCKQVQDTLKQVVERYGKDVRIVFKHNPLPFHERARPAAQVAIEAYRQRGAEGFWKINQALFESQDALDDERLLALGKRLGLDSVKLERVIRKNAHDRVIEEDQSLAMDFEARGTPHFFINGRRLSGAQPLEEFVALVDEQLEKARELVASGTPRARVYEKILEAARGAPPPDVLDLGTPPKDRPSRGPARAPVTIRVFSDFQCPFCNRVRPTLDALRAAFPKEVRVVFHNLPLGFHRRARAAANAAFEARAQRGDVGFWKMHDLLFQNQADLSDETLAEHAKTIGIDAQKVLDAVRSGRYDSLIDEDAAMAQRAGIRGTPAFSVNGYFISGAQPLERFRRAVRRALDDHKRGIRPKPNYPSKPAPTAML